MNKPMTTTARAMTICIAMTLGYSAAHASPDGALNYLVRFSDLDLSRIEGATALYARLQHAAKIVCEPFDSRDMGIAAKYRACMDQAIGEAVASVNRPLLSRHHERRTTGNSAGIVQLAQAN